MHFRSEKTYKHFNTVAPEAHDAGYKGLLKQSKQTPKFVVRSKKQIFTYYQSTDKNGVVEFITPSGTTPGVWWRQRIKLEDLDSLLKKYKDKWKPKQIVAKAIQGKLKVQCNDPAGGDEPSWLYWGFKYKASIQGYNLGKKEDRKPDIRNPRLKGSTCKHLIAAMQNLPFHTGVIVKDLTKTGVFE